MRNVLKGAAAAIALLAGSGAGTAAMAQVAGVPQPQHACQRSCLEGFVDRYLQAMADGNVDPNLFAKEVRFTENGMEMSEEIQDVR